MEEQLLETWRINNRINLYLLDALDPEALPGISTSKGRSVGQMLAHVHGVRLMWLKASAPDLLATVAEVPKEQANDKDLLRRALEESGAAMETLLRRGLETGRVKSFKPHPVAFLGYLLSHDGYHRGEIGIVLAQSGHPLSQKTSYGLWEWGVR